MAVNLPSKQSRVRAVLSDEASPARAMAEKALPWLAGAGMAVGHAAVSSNCTLTAQGRCTACGSCIVVVGSLVAWATARKRRGDDFYAD